MMGPSHRSRRTRKSSSSSSRRKINFKNSKTNHVKVSTQVLTNDSSKADESKDLEKAKDMCSDNADCSTPKAERYRIPEIKTCPPAPKKRRTTNNCSMRRTTTISYFAHPDIELFFNFALFGIPV